MIQHGFWRSSPVYRNKISSAITADYQHPKLGRKIKHPKFSDSKLHKISHQDYQHNGNFHSDVGQ